MLSTGQAVYYSVAMGLVILLCRILPFILFGRSADEKGGTKKRTFAFLSFVERVVPPVAMTVLAFNAISGPVKENPEQALPVLSASLFTALAQLWKRNAFLSIAGGTAVYMLLRAWAAS
ncbi:MAG: AzlD domain-containing protein [Spirochaetaceae bacterium]|jgi:branched-subunit amino acid transport protein AzlD|nr:AzlD domain-containing protein [Spirochaetaceae bacterium]